MSKEKISLNVYRKIHRVLGGRGLTRFPMISFIRNFALKNLRPEHVHINGHDVILDCWRLVGTCNDSDGNLYFKVDLSDMP